MPTRAELLKMGAKPVSQPSGAGSGIQTGKSFTREQLIKMGATPVGQAKKEAPDTSIKDIPIPSELQQTTLGQLPRAASDVAQETIKNIAPSLAKTAYGFTIGQGVEAAKMIAEGIKEAPKLPSQIKSVFQRRKEIPAALKSIAPIAAQGAYETIVPEAGRQILAGEFEEAGRTVMQDPIGQTAQIAALGLGGEHIAAKVSERRGAFTKPISELKPAPRPLAEGAARATSAFGKGVKDVVTTSPEKRLAKAETLLRDVLPQPKSSKKAEMKAKVAGRQHANGYKAIAEHGAIPAEKLEGGRVIMDSTAAEAKLQSEIHRVEPVYQEALALDPTKKHNISNLKNDLVGEKSTQGRYNSPDAEIKFDSAEQQNKVRERVAKTMDAEIQASGEVIDNVALNKIKRGLYEQSYTERGLKNTDVAKGLASAAAKIARMLESTNEGIANVKQLNMRLGELIEGRKILDASHGKTIGGGALRRIAARTVGAVIGTATGGPVGGAVGFVAGEKALDIFASPTRRFRKFEGKFKGKESTTKTIAETQKLKEQTLKRREATPKLEAGKTVFGKAPKKKPVETKPLTQKEIAKARIESDAGETAVYRSGRGFFEARNDGSVRQLNKAEVKVYKEEGIPIFDSKKQALDILKESDSVSGGKIIEGELVKTVPFTKTVGKKTSNFGKRKSK